MRGRWTWTGGLSRSLTSSQVQVTDWGFRHNVNTMNPQWTPLCTKFIKIEIWNVHILPPGQRYAPQFIFEWSPVSPEFLPIGRLVKKLVTMQSVFSFLFNTVSNLQFLKYHSNKTHMKSSLRVFDYQSLAMFCISVGLHTIGLLGYSGGGNSFEKVIFTKGENPRDLKKVYLSLTWHQSLA